MQRLRVLTRASQTLVAAAATMGLLLAGPAALEPAPSQGPRIDKVSSGQKVPALKLKALYPGEAQPRPLDLGAALGRRPVVVCYIVLGEAIGEEGILGVQKLVNGQLKGKVDLFGATRLSRKVTVATAAERMKLLGIEAPFVLEESPELGVTLGVTTAPSITLIDGGGVLRIPDARSLKQLVAHGVSMSQAIESAARGGPVPTVERLARYYPVNELVGERHPDFILKEFEGPQRIKLSEAVARDKQERKVPILFFWHPNCPHCKTAMPSIVVGYKAYGKYIDLISVVDVKNQDEARNTRDTIRAHGITFPVLEDEQRRISDMYRVVSTPTMVFLTPDGVIDSAYTSGEANYVTVFSAKIRSILGIGPPKK